jgi:hypothetical protein
MTQQDNSPRAFGWSGVILWTVLTMLGVFLAMGLHFPGDMGVSRLDRGELNLSGGLLGFVFGAVTGLMIGGAQALAARDWLPNMRAWLLLNAAGYGLVHALADAVPFRPLPIVAGGLIVPLAQYLALRPALLRPRLWLPLSAAAWWLGFTLLSSDDGYHPLVLALTLALVTGLGLKMLLRPAAARRSGVGPAWAGMNTVQRVGLVALSAIGAAGLLLAFATLIGLGSF